MQTADHLHDTMRRPVMLVESDILDSKRSIKGMIEAREFR